MNHPGGCAFARFGVTSALNVSSFATGKNSYILNIMVEKRMMIKRMVSFESFSIGKSVSYLFLYGEKHTLRYLAFNAMYENVLGIFHVK